MGIKDLSNIIRPFKRQIEMDEIKGYRVAVDTLIFLYKFIRSSDPSSSGWIDKFIDFVRNLRKRRIKPIFVFDGPNVPREKAKEQNRRRMEEEKQREKLAELKTLVVGKENLRLVIETVSRLFPKDGDKELIPDTLFELRKYVELKIKKLDMHTASVSGEVVGITKELIRILGFVCIQADGEAETLCVDLAFSGKVEAVVTQDTDVLVYPVGKKGLILLSNVYDESVSILSKQRLLEEMDLDEEKFRDMCILLSCDYNQRVYGFGPVKVLKLVRTCDSVEEMVEKEFLTQEDLEEKMINLKRCRELFTPVRVDTQIEMNKPVDEEALECFLKNHHCKQKIEKILKDWISLI
jgi:5'-3' exonuclease